jgi:hypothetical protein
MVAFTVKSQVASICHGQYFCFDHSIVFASSSYRGPVPFSPIMRLDNDTTMTRFLARQRCLQAAAVRGCSCPLHLLLEPPSLVFNHNSVFPMRKKMASKPSLGQFLLDEEGPEMRKLPSAGRTEND